MDNNTHLDSETLQSQLQSVSETIKSISIKLEGDSIALLTVLRTLEQSHREVREGLFREALPDNRQKLYHLLREIESEGGWPYIPRVQLRSLYNQLSHQLENHSSTETDSQ